MRIGLICFSDAGASLAEHLCGLFAIDKSDVHSTGKFAFNNGFTAHESVSADMATLFAQYDALLFLCACGIAVRAAAPHLKNKTTDPAVLVMDDHGKYVIPILSGHIGGANALAQQVAALTGAQAVITTATDGTGRFSCDAWAARHGCAISSMQLAKEVSAAILTRDIPVASAFPLPEMLPAGLVKEETGALGIYIGVKAEAPFQETLRLIPRIVTIGVGCRRGTPEETIFDAITAGLDQYKVDIRAVCRIASIDVKRNEAGLLACAEKLGVCAVFFTAQELNAVPGTFEESAFVKQTVGVGNVCERAALCRGGRLLVPKTAVHGVTLAAAIEDWSVEF